MDAQRRAVAYARERVQFESALIAKQGLTHKLLLPHIVRLQAARAYIQETARRLDAGEEELQVEGSVAKLFATEAGCVAADAAVQVHGGYGYVQEYHVEKIRRDVRITTIYEGTSEIQQEIVGRDRWRRLQIRGGAWARELQAELVELGRRVPDVGAEQVAAALGALVGLVREARAARLGRQQHVIFELADAVTEVEVAAALSRKAARLPAGAALRAMARIQAGDAACFAARCVARVLAGTSTLDAGAASKLDGELHPGHLLARAHGRTKDLDALAARLPEDDLLTDPLPVKN